MLVKQALTPAAAPTSADLPLMGLSERVSETATAQSDADVQACGSQGSVGAASLARYELGCEFGHQQH